MSDFAAHINLPDGLRYDGAMQNKVRTIHQVTDLDESSPACGTTFSIDVEALVREEIVNERERFANNGAKPEPAVDLNQHRSDECSSEFFLNEEELSRP